MVIPYLRGTEKTVTSLSPFSQTCRYQSQGYDPNERLGCRNQLIQAKDNNLCPDKEKENYEKAESPKLVVGISTFLMVAFRLVQRKKFIIHPILWPAEKQGTSCG